MYVAEGPRSPGPPGLPSYRRIRGPRPKWGSNGHQLDNNSKNVASGVKNLQNFLPPLVKIVKFSPAAGHNCKH
jgi:hypothetical protein